MVKAFWVKIRCRNIFCQNYDARSVVASFAEESSCAILDPSCKVVSKRT